MILYKNNPNLNLKTVVTVKGDKEYRVNCKYIKKEYHTIDRDCFYVGTQWYRINSGFIEFDHEKRTWVLKEEHRLIHGLVGFDAHGKAIYGFFTANPYENCEVVGLNVNISINSQILEDNGYIERLDNGAWYQKAGLSASDLRRVLTITSSKDYTNKGYNIEDNTKEFALKQKLYAEYPIEVSKDAKRFGRFLGDTTFGLEIESCNGNLPDHLQNRLGVVTCRDGSINSAEYVTVPMAGAKGLQNIHQIGTELSKRVNTDLSCSLHIHLGNIPLDRPYVCALYILFYKIQNDLFKMFPYYKTDPRNIKHKNYCQKLEKLSIFALKDKSKEGYSSYVEDTFTKIFMFLSEGVAPDEHFNRRDRRHPQRQKWNILSRYYALNMVNLFFSNRNTAEFRMHENTTNPQKMINWLFICNAIVRFAEDNTERILTGEISCNIDNVLNFYRTHYKNNDDAAFLSDYLKAYYEERVGIFQEDLKNEDKLSEHFSKKDKNYTFKYKNVSNLV